MSGPDQGNDNIPSIRILRSERPTIRAVLAGPPNDPLVVEQSWSDGHVERKRIVNQERSFQVPTFVFWDETVTPDQQQLTHEAITELMTEIGFDRNKVQYFGNWREPDYRDQTGKLKPHKSIEWQVKSKRDKLRPQVNADSMLFSMFDDPYQIVAPHWEVIITNEDLFSPDTNFVIGAALPDLGTIISLRRLATIQNPRMRREAQKTEIYHEVSHVLGLPTSRRGGDNLDYSLGPHCRSNGCSMKQGLQVPRDWIVFTEERLRQGGKPLCGVCVEDLQQKFHRAP